MKNIPFLICCFLLQIAFVDQTNAQNWITTGNSGIGPANYIGTKNSADLILKTNSTEVGRFTPQLSGSIGKGNSVDPNTTGAFAAGTSNVINSNSHHSVALGYQNTIEGANEFCLGVDNSAYAPYSGCVGVNLESLADHSLTFGIGWSPTNPLQNTTQASIVLGVYQPTVFITETLMSIGNIAPDPFYTLTVSGDVIANNTWLISDKRFKKDIRSLDNVLDRVLALRGTQYLFRTDEFKEKNLSAEKQFGFIAQELKEVFPELVRENEGGFHSVNYTGMIPVLVEAIKEQEVKIEAKDEAIACLQTQLESLEARLARLEAQAGYAPADARTQTQPKTGKAFGISPNPSNGRFQISLPETSVTEASTVLIFDVNGREVARQNIEAGSTTATLDLNLTNGLYNVTLLSHGKLSATQTLVVAQ